VTRYLGVLAGCIREWDAALEHLHDARSAGVRMDSPPTVLRALVDEAALLMKRDEPGDAAKAKELVAEGNAVAIELGDCDVTRALRKLSGDAGPETAAPAEAARVRSPGPRLSREGDTWTFQRDGRVVHLRDSRGVRCLAILLSNPGVEFPALSLVAGGVVAEQRSGAESDLASSLGGGDDAGAILDSEAKAAYRKRLEDLEEDLEEARSFNDPERAVQAQEEIEFLSRELAAAVGLGGRDRKAASDVERARVSVTKAIRAALKKLDGFDEALGHELRTTVRTGSHCIYEPDPRDPVTWRVSGM
jgi:hypothetical protein